MDKDMLLEKSTELHCCCVCYSENCHSVHMQITAGNFYFSQTVFALECRFECPLIHQFLLQLKKHGSKTSDLMQQYRDLNLPIFLLEALDTIGTVH
jgi:hypothetical protein